MKLRATIGISLALVAVVLIWGCGGGGTRQEAPVSASDETPAAQASPAKSWAGKTAAPPIANGLTWFNVSRPLTLDELNGKVVVLDFWTLGCINCQHIIPDLKRLKAEFGDALAVIGVHSGKYATEHDDDSVREAIRKYGLEHPVVNDPDFAVWQTFGANAWPFLVIIDPAGNLVGVHAGEGVYPLFQPIIQSLVSEFEAKGAVKRAPLPLQGDGVAASTVLSYPSDVLADGRSARLYIADAGHNRILVSDLSGRLIQAIGSGKHAFADGGAAEAAFREPQGLALSANGKTLYVADTRNHAVRAVDLTTYEVSTIAGTGKQLDRLPRGGAKGTETALGSPWDLVQAGDWLYISMAGVHQVWRLNPATGAIEVFAGTSREGLDDGDRLSHATLAQPSGIVSDGDWLYWVDPEASAVRRLRIAGQGDVETLIGTGLFDYGADDGPGLKASLQHPQGLALDGGRLLVGDTYNHKVRAYDLAARSTTTLAGLGERGFNDGPGMLAEFDEPAGLSIAGGTLYVADQNNHLIRTVDTATGRVATLTLSNLSVAASGAPGKRVAVELPAMEVAEGVGAIRLIVRAPRGYHLNSQAPSQAVFATDRADVVTPSEPEVRWSSDEPSVTLPVPARFAAGATRLTASLAVYYCREGEEALCFIQHVDLVVPVQVSASSTNGDLEVAYVLPESST